MSTTRLSKEEKAERVAFVAGLLGLMYSEEELLSATCKKFDCSPRVAAGYIKAARSRALFATRNRRHLQDALGHGYVGLYRAVLAKRGTVPCPQCEAKVPVPNPSIGTAAVMLKGMLDLWKLQASPEDMLSDDELRAATVTAMVNEVERFTTDELAVLIDVFGSVMERRKPAQMPLL